MATVNIGMIKESAARFGADAAPTYAASIAYSAIFAIAPLLIIAIGIAGELLGVARGGHQHHVVEDQVINSLAGAVGSGTAESVRGMVDAAFQSHQGSVLAQIIGWATFVIAASGLLLALQTGLNKVWDVHPKQSGLWRTLRDRLVSSVMLLVIGVVILGTILLNFVFAYLWDHFTAFAPFPGASSVFSVVNWLVSLAVITVLFAALYRVLPDTEIAWNDVWAGAIVTALLFVFGEALLGVYISHVGISNGYGAAGSLVVLLVWAYYSSMLLLFGAELSRVYAERHGSRASQPDSDAPAAGPSTERHAGELTYAKENRLT